MSNGRIDTSTAWLKIYEEGAQWYHQYWPTAQRLLCWWHVLRACRNNLKRTYDPDGLIWEKLQYLLKESDNVVRDFDTIKGIASAEFNRYFERTWMTKKGRSCVAYIETQNR
jgi:hypothetical protein